MCSLQNKIPINYFSLHDKNTRFITLLPLGHWFNFVQLLALRKNTELYHVGETLVFHLDNALFIQRGLSTAQRGIEPELSVLNSYVTRCYFDSRFPRSGSLTMNDYDPRLKITGPERVPGANSIDKFPKFEGPDL